MRLTKALLGFEGAFYVAAGLWPIIHLRSFERVTGPKLEGWLVKTIGGLITVCGLTFLQGARRGRAAPLMLAMGAPAVLGGSGAWYAARGRISPVYYLDAVAEGAIIAAWVAALTKRTGNESSRPVNAPPPTHVFV